eukprot:2416025-Rhodomonas_salina.1
MHMHTNCPQNDMRPSSPTHTQRAARARALTRACASLPAAAAPAPAPAAAPAAPAAAPAAPAAEGTGAPSYEASASALLTGDGCVSQGASGCGGR